VSSHEGEHLRRFVAARTQEDTAGMRRWWEELVIDFADRMDQLVWLAHQGRLDAHEHELAVQMSLIKFATRLIETFEGVSMGELVNASKRLAWGICIDVQRQAVREREREGRSLDAGWDADVEDRGSSTWEADEAAARLDRERRSAEVLDFLAWALPQLNDDQRRAIELTHQGATIPEIMAELGVERDNAYQLRSRGMKRLAKLKEQYDT
jgi:hypothetical protein